VTCTAALHYSYAGPTSWWLGLDGTCFVASRYGREVGSRKAASRLTCDSLARIPSFSGYEPRTRHGGIRSSSADGALLLELRG